MAPDIQKFLIQGSSLLAYAGKNLNQTWNLQKVGSCFCKYILLCIVCILVSNWHIHSKLFIHISLTEYYCTFNYKDHGLLTLQKRNDWRAKELNRRQSLPDHGSYVPLLFIMNALLVWKFENKPNLNLNLNLNLLIKYWWYVITSILIESVTINENVKLIPSKTWISSIPN